MEPSEGIVYEAQRATPTTQTSVHPTRHQMTLVKTNKAGTSEISTILLPHHLFAFCFVPVKRF